MLYSVCCMCSRYGIDPCHPTLLVWDRSLSSNLIGMGSIPVIQPYRYGIDPCHPTLLAWDRSLSSNLIGMGSIPVIQPYWYGIDPCHPTLLVWDRSLSSNLIEHCFVAVELCQMSIQQRCFKIIDSFNN